jgi:hypothetical protein
MVNLMWKAGFRGKVLPPSMRVLTGAINAPIVESTESVQPAGHIIRP